MKQQLPSAGHDRHDATLIVRLYDGDVSERERDRANALLAECAECAQLYADLTAIADMTRSLPTPARPRDFFLTEADAARLGRPDGVPVRAPGRWSWRSVRRSVGGALAALGLVGVLATGGSSLLTSSPTARFSTSDTGNPNVVPAAQPMPATGGVAVATAAPAQLGPATEAQTPASQAAQLPGETARNTTALNASSAPATASPLDMATAAAAASAAPTPAASAPTKSAATAATTPATPPMSDGQIAAAASGDHGHDNGGGTSGGSTAVSAPTIRSGGFDLASVAFAGFGLALALGLALLVGPRIVRTVRRTR